MRERNVVEEFDTDVEILYIDHKGLQLSRVLQELGFSSKILKTSCRCLWVSSRHNFHYLSRQVAES